MSLATRVLFICLGPLLLAAACDSAPALPSASDFHLRLDDTFCQRYAACGGAVTYETCRDDFWVEQGAQGGWGPTLAQLATGRVVFHADRAQACLDALEHASCSAAVGFERALDVDDVCHHIFEGVQEADGPCAEIGDDHGSYFNECKLGLFCMGADACPQDTCCEGHCVVDTNAVTATEGQACDPSGYCSGWLVCQPDFVCRVPSALNDTCNYYCAGDTICDHGLCKLPPATIESGVTACGDGLSDSHNCDSTHYCGDNGICYAALAAGRPCGPSVGWCDSFLTCDATSSLCVPRHRLGEACSADAECLGTPSLCENGRCVQPHANGDACTVATQCMSGVCTSGVCSDWVTCPAP